MQAQAQRMPSLILDIKPGEKLALTSASQMATVVELVKKSGQLVRLRVTAPSEVRIEKQATQMGIHVPSMANLLLERQKP
jgi:hypothetical protein